MDPLTIGLIGSGLSGIINSITNVGTAKSNRDFDFDMWNRQNSYNSPVNQMKRLKEAGINPNSVVGHGSIVGNTAAAAPRSNLPTSLQPMEGVLNSLNASIDFENKAAQNKLITAQTTASKAQAHYLDKLAGQTKSTTSKINVETQAKQRELDILEGKRSGGLPGDPAYYRYFDRATRWLRNVTGWW